MTQQFNCFVIFFFQVFPQCNRWKVLYLCLLYVDIIILITESSVLLYQGNDWGKSAQLKNHCRELGTVATEDSQFWKSTKYLYQKVELNWTILTWNTVMKYYYVLSSFHISLKFLVKLQLNDHRVIF